jgi:two-component system LytT family response regulator
VIFLDIQMPVISGIELVGMLDEAKMPRVVFVTAYDEYALKAIEKHAFDYLLKPLEPKKLYKCISRLERDIDQKEQPAYTIPQISRIPCRIGKRIKLIDPKDVEYACTSVAGVRVVTRENQLFTDITLKTIEKKTGLFRCQKQYLINLSHIDEIIPYENGSAEAITKSKNRVPVSRRFFRPLKRQLMP